MQQLIHIFILVVIAAQTTLATSYSQDNNMHIEHIFIPEITMQGDSVVVIASGWLPSPCYHSPYAEISREGSSISISIRAIKDTRDRNCLMLAIPYLIEIPLGALAAGCYLIEYGPDNLRSEVLTIGLPQLTSQNNDLYAYVEDVTFDQATSHLKLSGRNPSDCIVLDHISYISNDSDTYTIWPIMKRVQGSCPKKLVPFEYSVDLSNKLKNSQVLYHVMTLRGGNSFINYLPNVLP